MCKFSLRKQEMDTNFQKLELGQTASLLENVDEMRQNGQQYKQNNDRHLHDSSISNNKNSMLDCSVNVGCWTER